MCCALIRLGRGVDAELKCLADDPHLTCFVIRLTTWLNDERMFPVTVWFIGEVVVRGSSSNIASRRLTSRYLSTYVAAARLRGPGSASFLTGIDTISEEKAEAFSHLRLSNIDAVRPLCEHFLGHAQGNPLRDHRMACFTSSTIDMSTLIRDL